MFYATFVDKRRYIPSVFSTYGTQNICSSSSTIFVKLKTNISELLFKFDCDDFLLMQQNTNFK